MESLLAYIPSDRLGALIRHENLPDWTNGAALFADISGFTPLTESLCNALGPRRGAEELTKHLETVYSVLIAEVDHYGGSVIGFAGDAMLCWFDGALVASRQDISVPCPSALAVASALAMQQAMGAFARIALPDHSAASLGLKVTVASGPARRFVVGSPKAHLMDVLAGATVTRTAAAEHLASKGEVLTDAATAEALGERLVIREWREDPVDCERFAVVKGLTQPVRAAQARMPTADGLKPEELNPWLFPSLVERERAGQTAFLNEFRPCVALFVRFIGIDYDGDEAAEQLNEFIFRAQAIVQRHGGTLLEITIGDKGSYAYINFGVFTAHEDDEHRAVQTALELRNVAQDLSFLEPLQMGVTQGALRVGANGGQTRRSFVAMGDEVNLAARLMSKAAPGEILLSSRVQRATESQFVFEPRPPVPFKGKAEPLPVFAVTGERRQRAYRLQEPNYALPMIGRAAELQIIGEKLDRALQNNAQVIGIVSDAGLGKSRLVAEVIRLARKKGFVGYGGACQSDGMNNPYLVWKSVWSAFFDVDPELPVRKQIRLLEGDIEDRTPERVQAMPLLSSLLDIAIAENEFTRALEPQHRKSALHALLLDCLESAAKEQPLLVVIEDAHWIDAMSHELLDELAKGLANSAICFLLAYRPQHELHVEGLPSFTRIELRELTRSEAEQAIRAKLAQLYPARRGAVPPELVDRLMQRAQGNPFYLEELLNYLRDRGLDPRDPADLEKIELPDSLHTLVLSRIDQLTEHEKSTLRVASIIGRLFPAAWLAGYYPVLGNVEHVKADLQELDALDITPVDPSERELAYLFKHIVLHEVTYESLPFATRSKLHELLAQYIEQRVEAGDLSEAPFLDTLVHHYAHSANEAKQLEYLLMAGRAAEAAYANDAAVSYYRRAIALQPESQQAATMLRLAQVLELMGEWTDAEAMNRKAEALARSFHNAQERAQAEHALGILMRKRGVYAESEVWLERARTKYEETGNAVGISRVLSDLGELQRLQGKFAEARTHYDGSLQVAARIVDPKAQQAARAYALKGAGVVANWTGEYAEAKARYEESLALCRELGDSHGVAVLLNNLGVIARFQRDLNAAWEANAESLALFRKMGNRWALGQLLNNQACIASDQGDYAQARSLLEESLSIRRQLGDKAGLALSLNTLADVLLDQGDYGSVTPLLEESLSINRELGDRTAIAYLLEDYAGLAAAGARAGVALQLAGFAAALRDSIGAPLPAAEQARLERMLAPAKAALSVQDAASAWETGRSMSSEEAIDLARLCPSPG